MRRTGHTMCVKIDGPDRILKTNTPTQKSSHLPNKDEFASERIKDRKQNKEITEVSVQINLRDYYIIFKVENVDNRLTAALLSAGLSNFVRSDTSSSSRTESPDIIPGKDSPKSFASSDDLDSSISVKTNAVWETTEQRMNTKAPVSFSKFP